MDTVHVWVFPTRLSDGAVTALSDLLDREERRRAGAIPSPVRRQHFIAAHGGARTILGGHLGTDPAGLRWRRGAHGKPELVGAPDGVRVNLSHSGGHAALAVARGRAVGVDLQQVRPVDTAAMAGRFFLPHEASLVGADGPPDQRLDRFFRLWVRKEACVKAAGARLLSGLRVPVAGTGPSLLVHGAPDALPGPFRVHDLPAPGGFHAAVALAGTGACRVVPHP